MGVLRTLSMVLGIGSDITVIYECRRCGANVSRRTDLCPHCETMNIAVYEIE